MKTRKMRTVFRRLLVFIIVLSLCMGLPGMGMMDVSAKQKKVKKITLNEKKIETYVGAKNIKLKVASVKPAGASKKVTWKSSNKKIATVSSKGVVKIKKKGTVKITAISKLNPKVKKTCTIKVYAATKSMKLTSSSSCTLEVGKTTKVTAKVTKPKKGAQPIKWSSNNDKVATVTSKGIVTAVAAGTTTITGQSGKKKVKIQVTVTASSRGTTNDDDNDDNNDNDGPVVDNEIKTKYTRGEWVSLLVDEMMYEISENEVSEYSFLDISKNKNALKIEAAFRCGIIPREENSTFCPDDNVTREFAAVTAVNAIGYTKGDNAICSDSALLTYPSEVKIAIEQGFFELKNGAFAFADYVTEAEFEKIIKIINENFDDWEISPTYENKIEYKSSVVSTEQIGEYIVSAEGDVEYITVSQNDITNSFEEGQIIILPESDEYENGLPWKISSVKEEDGTIVMEGTTPNDISEVFEKIDIQGLGRIDINNIVLGEGVSIAQDDTPAVIAEKAVSSDVLPLNYNEDFIIDMGDSDGEAKVNITIPQIEYAVDYDTNELRQFVIKVPNSITFSYEREVEWSKDLHLVTIPIQCAAGISINIDIYGIVGVGGKLEFEYVINSEFGVCYDNSNGIKRISTAHREWTGVLGAEAYIGVRLSPKICWLNIPLYSVGTEAGLAVNAEITARNEPELTCIDANAWVYWKYNLGDEDDLFVLLIPDLTYEDDIWDKDSSPFKENIHYEDFEKVDRCSYEKSGTYRGMDWEIDKSGNLTVTGMYNRTDLYDDYMPTWLDYKEYIKSATVKAKNVESTDYWFWYCENLLAVDLSEFDTSKVKSMYGMFDTCSSLTSLELSNFDTSNVTDMSDMFYGCNKLTDINVSSFDTSNVTDMSCMFAFCKLKDLKLSNFDTGNVTDMTGMFMCCDELTSLNLSNFNTSRVTDMASMFYECCELEYLDLSSFCTSNVTNMSFLFAECDGLKNINLSSFDTSSVEDMSSMFVGCTNLENLDIKNFNTSKVKNMDNMFDWCCDLMYLDISSFDFGAVESADDMLAYEAKIGSVIIAPKGLDLNIELPQPEDIWQGDDGEEYSDLPIGLSESMILTCVEYEYQD